MTTTAQHTVPATPARPGPARAVLPREGHGAGARSTAPDAVPPVEHQQIPFRRLGTVILLPATWVEREPTTPVNRR
ncbi:MAG: DNA-binding protein [Cellulomonas sp.]|uniref:DNA-binding protein n=1 Tax=Cellulomonas sp. TaxID=40001 RepID=UPI00258A0D13|nr:DNA-binding protein [Cellulomonas sp.]MCR6705663.1 DNA-binding protein [Cellulomonas sp.]